MPATALTPQDITVAGLTEAFTAVDNVNGNSFANNGLTFLHVKNTGGAAVTVTLVSAITVGSLAVADPTVTVAATTGDKIIGPFPPGIYNRQDGSGIMDVTFSTGSGVTAAVIRAVP